MKKLLAVFLVLGAGFFLGVIFPGGPGQVKAGGVAPVALQNGDVNGDGAIDISDAVYTLLFLFRDGAPPVSLADSPQLVARIAQLEGELEAARAEGTQLRAELDSLSSAQANCQATLKDCQEARASSALGERYVDNGDGTLTDRLTDLTWARGATQDRYYQAAVSYCDDLDFAGHSDWRIPTATEAFTLAPGRKEDGTPFGVGLNEFWVESGEGPTKGFSCHSCDSVCGQHCTVVECGVFTIPAVAFRVLPVRGP